jgi:geranylgeranylglycerol-phosphate geranylgeranyltransferase
MGGRNRPALAERRTVGGRVADAASLTRLENCVAAGVATVLGGYLAGGGQAAGSSRVFRAALTVAGIVAATNVLNDAVDVEVDRLAKPFRAIPSGRVSQDAARRMAWWLGAISILIAATLGAGPAAVAAAFLGLSVAYCHRLKSTVLVGNAVVAFLTASTLVYGAWVAGPGGRGVGHALLAAIVILPFIVAFEVLKCVEDRDTDAAGGLRTVATDWGVQRSVLLCQCLLAVLAIALAVGSLAGWLPMPYALATLAGTVLPSLVAVLRLDRMPSPAAARGRVQLMKVAWITGLGSVALLR